MLFSRILFVFYMIAAAAIAQDDSLDRGEAKDNLAKKGGIFKGYKDPTGKAYFPEGKWSYFTRYLSAMKDS